MSMPAVEPFGGAACEGECALTLEDIDSLLPGRCIALPVIEDFFRSQFGECLKGADAEHSLESCLVFGPDTWADLCRLLLPADGEAGAGQQGYPALERFCREHDLASKQYLLLPLLTPSHGSLFIFCQPADPQTEDVAAGQTNAQRPCILHLDSLSAQGGTQGHQPDCQALTRFLRPYFGEGHQAWAEELRMLTASVPQQGSAGLGASFMCTSALYFVANLPPSVDAAEVERLRSYRREPVDMFEGSEASCYPGFLTTMWYPLNVPEALRKLLLSGIVTRLQGQSATSATSSLLERAGQVQQILHTASIRQFEMQAERLSKQLEAKQRQLLAAGRHFWGQLGGWTSASGATCRQGWWSVELTKELMDEIRYGKGPVFEFADVQHTTGTPGQLLPPKPQEFDLCFGVELQEGQQPPPLVIHYMLRVTRWSMLTRGGGGRMAAPGNEHVREKVHFVPAPSAPGTPSAWCFERASWQGLRNYLRVATGPGCRLHLVQRPAKASHDGLVHVELQPRCLTDYRDPRPQQSASWSDSDSTAESTRTSGQTSESDEWESDVEGTSLSAGEQGSPRLAAGTPAAPDSSTIAAAISQPTEKGRKRLQTGIYGQGDRRARLTVNNQAYYGGSYPTAEAAAQAEDLLAIWAHFSHKGWPENWMQECEDLQFKLNYPLSMHMTLHGPLLMSLSGRADLPALRELLQKHFTEQANGAAAGGSWGAKRQRRTTPEGPRAPSRANPFNRPPLGTKAARGPPRFAIRHAAEQQPSSEDAPEQQEQQDSGSRGWPADARQQAADALAATETAATESELVAAQIDAVDAALQLPGAGLEFSQRLACTQQFRRLDSVLRSGLLAELRLIVRGGSAADLPAWMQDVARS